MIKAAGTCSECPNGSQDTSGYCIDPADAVNLDQDASSGIPAHHGPGLLVVQVQPVADNRLVFRRCGSTATSR